MGDKNWLLPYTEVTLLLGHGGLLGLLLCGLGVCLGCLLCTLLLELHLVVLWDLVWESGREGGGCENKNTDMEITHPTVVNVPVLNLCVLWMIGIWTQRAILKKTTQRIPPTKISSRLWSYWPLGGIISNAI